MYVHSTYQSQKQMRQRDVCERNTHAQKKKPSRWLIRAKCQRTYVGLEVWCKNEEATCKAHIKEQCVLLLRNIDPLTFWRERGTSKSIWWAVSSLTTSCTFMRSRKILSGHPIKWFENHLKYSGKQEASEVRKGAGDMWFYALVYGIAEYYFLYSPILFKISNKTFERSF